MIQYNFHTHTTRCGHAIGEDEEYVTSAIKGGLNVLGFSDHAPFSYEIESERMRLDQYEDYKDSILKLRKKYEDQIEILLGLECEMYTDEFERVKQYRRELDYLICGQHQLSLYGTSSYKLHDISELKAYADILTYGASLGLIDCFAHPDVCMWEYPKWDEGCAYVAETIAKASKKYNIPVELNCGAGVKKGMRDYEDGTRYPYPLRQFFEIFARHNCDVLVGLDVHDPSFFLTDTYLNRALAIVEGLPLHILDRYDMKEEAKKRKQQFGYM